MRKTAMKTTFALLFSKDEPSVLYVLSHKSLFLYIYIFLPSILIYYENLFAMIIFRQVIQNSEYILFELFVRINFIAW